MTFVRGSDFFPGASAGRSSARLAFSYESPERIARASRSSPRCCSDAPVDSLGMIDHVGIRLPSLAEGERFYGRAFELLGYPGEPYEGGGFVEWDDFAIGEATDERR